MIAVDSNLLIYAHRRDSPWYKTAYACMATLAEGRAAWAIPWPCVHEYLAIVTHPKIYVPPSTTTEAIAQIDAWLRSPSVTILAEGEGYWHVLRSLVSDGQITGPKVHDARIAALCRLHGVRELWTADRDFNRFRELVVRNPLVGQ